MSSYFGWKDNVKEKIDDYSEELFDGDEVKNRSRSISTSLSVQSRSVSPERSSDRSSHNSAQRRRAATPPPALREGSPAAAQQDRTPGFSRTDPENHSY